MKENQLVKMLVPPFKRGRIIEINQATLRVAGDDGYDYEMALDRAVPIKGTIPLALVKQAPLGSGMEDSKDARAE